MNNRIKYNRSLSTRNDRRVHTVCKGQMVNLTPVKRRVNLSRIDGYENIIPQLQTPQQLKNLVYPAKIIKQSPFQEQSPFNSIVQGFFLPTPRKVSLQINKIITEPTPFSSNSPVKRRQNNCVILKHNITDEEYDPDKQLNIPQKIRLYFSCQKLQKRLFKLQELLQFISIKSIYQHLSEMSNSTIDYIAEFDLSYKQFILTELLCIVLYFLMKYNLIKKDELTRLEKLIIYQHQQNVCNTIHNFQISVVGFKTYMHLFYQLQQANPQIPTHIDALNKYVDKTINDLINKELQLHLKDYLYMKIETKTIDFVQMLKKLMDTVQEHLYFLPKVENEYTLIFDLEETLIHYQDKQLLIRPFLNELLEELSRYYEIVIFGHLPENEVSEIVDKIDPNRYVKHKLNKNHLMKYEKVFIKDLTLLGRPGNKYIVIDNDPFNFLLSTENGVQIRSWYGDSNDRALSDLIPYLGDLRLYKDVRIGLKQVKSYSQYFFVSQ